MFKKQSVLKYINDYVYKKIMYSNVLVLIQSHGYGTIYPVALSILS